MDLFVCVCLCVFFFFFKQKTAYEMRISDWSSDVCSSDLAFGIAHREALGDDGLGELDHVRQIDDRPRMADAETTIGQHLAHDLRQLQQSQQVDRKSVV